MYKQESTWKKVFYAVFVVFVAGISALAGVVGGGIAVFSAVQANNSQQALDQPAQPAAFLINPQDETPQPQQIYITDINTAVTDAVDKVALSVVTVVGTMPGVTTFFGQTGESTTSGSGFIISEDGYILTNYHVVDGARNVRVILADGTELPATVVNSDIFADLAVLKVEGEMPAVAALGDSGRLRSGETVIAIGSPLGDFKNSVTVGVVSATGRSIETSKGFFMEDLIQTDAAINQGNSGGPLVNLAGEVIGINTLVVRGNGYSGTVAEGLGFAIPMDMARVIAEHIILHGYFARPYLGIGWHALSPALSARYNLDVDYGAYVSQVAAGSPAEKAGLQSGDIITKIGEKTINENFSFVNALFSYQPGDQVDLEVVQGVRIRTLTVTLGELKSDAH